MKNPSINRCTVGAIVFAMATFFFAACGGDSDSPSKVADNDDGREVATVVDMGRCTSEREGDTVYVAEKMKDYLCKNRAWVDLSEISDSESSRSSSSVVSDKTSEASVKSSSSSVASNTSSATSNASKASSSSKNDSSQNFIRENISVTGVAQKGPFKFGSPLNLYELKNDLTPSGRVYKDEINSNKGDFVIPKVSLAYPYAMLEVRGLYRIEVTGEWSKDSMTLRALTDFSDKRTEVNINLLTHLEYDRALYLVQEKGYNVFAAKKQAAQEIMTAFEFATAVTYSEDFAIFQNEGVSAGTIAGNASLLAISALVMGNRSDAEIQSVVDKFREDIKTDGEWNDLQTKADMADWAYSFKYDNIRASVKSWNILDIPDYETYLDVYWNNAYGLGGCSINRKDVVAPNSNKLSKNYNKYFICNSTKWVAATTYQKDTYGWSNGKNGEFKKGNVTDSIYVYNSSKWEFSERETAIGLCQKSNAGVISEFNSVYYICRDNAWTTATVLEYDTYGLTGVEGDVKTGVVNKDKYYVYENGKWRASTSVIDAVLGGCIENRDWVVVKSGSSYYICKSKTWTEASVLEYDTYGLTGVEGSIKAGVVNTSYYYIYKNGKWQSATSIEKDLGGCLASREGLVGKSENTYYICKSETWTKATVLEYDTYGLTGVEGDVKTGVVNKNKYYVYENGKWHEYVPLSSSSITSMSSSSLGKVSSSSVPEGYVDPSTVVKGTMIDSRDNQIYKTVKIGSQTWMAQNLNYNTANSYCYKDSAKYCTKYGRLYTWAAAMDSVGKWSTNGKGCGYGKTCSPKYPVRGVCPEGWHLPTKAEFEMLFVAVGGISTAGKILKSTTGWSDYNSKSGNGTDDYSFSALPVGDRSSGCYWDEGYMAHFWSSTEYNSEYAYTMYFYLYYYYGDNACLNNFFKDSGFSVRCVKD